MLMTQERVQGGLLHFAYSVQIRDIWAGVLVLVGLPGYVIGTKDCAVDGH